MYHLDVCMCHESLQAHKGQQPQSVLFLERYVHTEPPAVYFYETVESHMIGSIGFHAFFQKTVLKTLLMVHFLLMHGLF
jgi:hypothetical protein